MGASGGGLSAIGTWENRMDRRIGMWRGGAAAQTHKPAQREGVFQQMPTIHQSTRLKGCYGSFLNRHHFDFHDRAGCCQARHLDGRTRRLVGLGWGAEPLGPLLVHAGKIQIAVLAGSPVRKTVGFHHVAEGQAELGQRFFQKIERGIGLSRRGAPALRAADRRIVGRSARPACR